jgi:hypothetical protein
MDLLLVFYRLVVAGWLSFGAVGMQTQTAPVGSRRLRVDPQPRYTSFSAVSFGGQTPCISHALPAIGALLRADRNIQHPGFAARAGALERGGGFTAW